ncbi:MULTISPECIES: methionine ABC transporter ATP-binding protein [Brevibacterium]|uniref:ABC-type metal ion transporter ATPase n=2 Tax=Brevibacterium casei TaxID=33889 RepID=K9B4M2_9MICO|nr:methionine ABC transporter ATP-binding protein [Brevibacterium casei]NJE67235.1 ATP-binding cassette domain-containing protein [Brevibacterium sp. LS14]EKU48745.1 ABC-type metal ion transporter ATPase [Brevibacterium casei S18]KZE13411.1 methionine ABC transporter ATP-binding protein [Brevibacterium casei]MCT1765223.1 methionine ABC transporter ATP-binding protein [Brevibacterium casei]MDH5147748.1 methionine ABC transporter ATP-binding protein [Brevibacterium casei]
MIELRGLRKVFGHTVALEEIDLSVPAGEIHGIVGRSGAGKSTLIRCLTGLERPTSGTVSIDGTDLTEQTGAGLRQARRNIGMVFQHVNLLDSRTALDNVAHPLQIAGVGKAERQAKARELLEFVGLGDRLDNHPAQLSGGQRQRVGIARALAAEPKVLLCDEPTSALDASTTEQILGLIRSLRDRLGITVLIITHEMSVVREICDSVTLLADGRVAKTGKLAEVIAEPGSSLAKDLVPLPPVSLGDGESGIVEVALAGTTLPRVLTCAGSVDIGADAILAGAVETVEDRQVGRIRFSVSGPVQAGELIAAFDSEGIHAEEVAAK